MCPSPRATASFVACDPTSASSGARSRSGSARSNTASKFGATSAAARRASAADHVAQVELRPQPAPRGRVLTATPSSKTEIENR